VVTIIAWIYRGNRIGENIFMNGHYGFIILGSITIIITIYSIIHILTKRAMPAKAEILWIIFLIIFQWLACMIYLRDKNYYAWKRDSQG
jgi:hypothetical protein